MSLPLVSWLVIGAAATATATPASSVPGQAVTPEPAAPGAAATAEPSAAGAASTEASTGGAAATAEALSLEAALIEAASSNYDLKLAQNARVRADADLLSTWQGMLPRLDVGATFGRRVVGSQRTMQEVIDTSTDPPTSTVKPAWTEPTSYNDYTVYARFQQSLFEGFRSYSQRRQAEASRRAAELQIDEASLTIAFEVTRRFYELVKAQQSLLVLEETAKQSEELVARADALFRAGRIPAGDTYAARVNLGNDRINVETQRARLAQARTELAVVLGREVEPAFEVVIPKELDAVPTDATSAEPPALADLLQRAQEARPAKARSQELIRAAEAGERAASADWYPAVGLSVGYTRQSPDLYGDAGAYGRPDRQYVISGQLYAEWNLFGGYGTVSASDRAAADAERARLTADQVAQQIGAEVARARATLVAIGRAAALAGANLKSAEAAVRLARERFDAGTANQLEVRDAQLKLTQARLALVQTRSDYAVAYADLNRAVGGRL